MSHTLVAEWFCGVFLVVIGVSHIVAPRRWAGLFKDLFQRPYAGLVIGYLTLLVGLPLVLMHNVWKPSLGLIVTLVAWASVVKGTLYLLVPGLPARVGARHMEHPSRFVWGGLVSVLLGGAVVVRLVLLAQDSASA